MTKSSPAWEGVIAYLYYQGEDEPLRNMHVYIDLPNDQGFILYHGRTTETGKLCSIPLHDPTGPVHDPMWLVPGCEYLLYYEPEPSRDPAYLPQSECIAVTLSRERRPGWNRSRGVLEVERWYDDLEVSFRLGDEPPWQGLATPQARLVDARGATVAELPLDTSAVRGKSGGVARVRFPDVPLRKSFVVEVDGDTGVGRILEDAPLRATSGG